MPWWKVELMTSSQIGLNGVLQIFGPSEPIKMKQNKTKYCAQRSADPESLFANPGRPDPLGKLSSREQRPLVDAMSDRRAFAIQRLP